jgi:hypothetical protein
VGGRILVRVVLDNRVDSSSPVYEYIFRQAFHMQGARLDAEDRNFSLSDAASRYTLVLDCELYT